MSCPGCYKDGYDTFCNPCKKALFDGKEVSPVLPFDSPSDRTMQRFRKHTQRLSISGVQLKYSLKLDGTMLRLTDTGGQYILKPIPQGNYEHLDQAPENEHICMQLAKQVYGLETPANALIRFKDGSPAYLVKRFDVLSDGTKRRQEDFASLAGKTPDSEGEFKYDYSYEGIGKLMKQHIPAYQIEVEKFFRLVLFNYVIGNGDAHLKNFSVSATSLGDHQLSPTYDLLCTKLHIPEDQSMALDLFDNNFETPSYAANGFPAYDDFRFFGEKLGMKVKRIERQIAHMSEKLESSTRLVSKSKLNTEQKEQLIQHLIEYTTMRLEYRFKS